VTEDGVASDLRQLAFDIRRRISAHAEDYGMAVADRARVIRAMGAEGWTQARIAETFGLSVVTVRRLLRSGR
jgi:DNA-binding transcriptional regulator LsrR (DeoR family)